MLAVVFIGLYTTVLLVVYGAAFLAMAGGFFRFARVEPPDLLKTCLAGIIPLVWITSLLSIWIPLNEIAAILLFLGAAGLAVWLIRLRQNWITTWVHRLNGIHPLTLIVLLLALVTILILATLKPGNSDTGLYHAQAIRWIETYSVVPGLGNYHSRFAFNSNWFPLQAAFSFAFLGLRSFHLMGAVLTTLCMVYFTGGLEGLLSGKSNFSNWMRFTFIPLTFFVLASEISSTGTDLPVSLLTWVILCMWVETLEEPSLQLDWRKILLIALPLFLVSIKLSAFPLLLVSAWVLIPGVLQPDESRKLAVIAAFVLILWAPWLVRNVIISGYVLYPQTTIDIFNMDWKIPAKIVHDEAEWITSWARFPRLDKEIVLAMPLSQWVPMWFDDLTKNRQIILLVLAAAPLAFGMVFIGVFTFCKNKVGDWFQPIKLTWPLWVVAYSGILFWFFSVPRFRFGNGVLMAGLVLVCFYGIGFIRGIFKPFKRVIPYLAAIMISLYVVFVLAASVEPKTLASRALLPADYANLPTAPCSFGNFSTYCATQYQQCGYDPFPCVPQSFPNVYMRGENLGDGFIVR